VFSKGFLILEVENKYDTSIFAVVYLNPAPKEKYCLAPLTGLS
jgi:hypothetical protein